MIQLKNIISLTKLHSILPKPNIILKKIQYQIYQSKHFRPIIPLESLLNQNGIQFLSNQSVHRLKYCPFCKKPHNNDKTNFYTLNVNKQNGLYYCHRCQAKGSYLSLKKALLGINIDTIYQNSSNEEYQPSFNNTLAGQHRDNSPLTDAQYFIYLQNMKKDSNSNVREYLKSRGLTQQTLLKFQVGCGHQTFYNEDNQSVDIQVVYFPMYKLLSKDQQKKKLLKLAQAQHDQSTNISKLVKLKIRGVGKQNKKYMRQTPKGPSKGLFGLNTVSSSDKIVVITEGEFDCMSVYQQTGLPCVSLPQGANSLPDSILPYLDQFQKIILWMDNDQAGKMNIQKFSQKLGVSRTHIVINNDKKFKDANDFLMNKPQMIQELVRKAKNLPDQNIITFQGVKEQIRDRITNQKKFQGVQLETFKFFNRKVKGIRQAELSVVSGATGSGKTTFLSQLSLQLSQKKVPVLWGSFQIRNQILISNMLTQFSDINLKKNKVKFDYFADKFVSLPMYYMSFHGSNNINKVLGTITYAIEQYGVSFIVIDTLQFLLSGQAQGASKFDFQDYVMSQLRSITTAYNVHICVVIHPRKTQDNQDIGIHSIYGTSKATQQADNIWVIQNRDGFKIFQIKKNRYDGDVGRVAIGFNKENKTFFQLRKKELQAIFNKEKTVAELVLQREKEKQRQQEGGDWMKFDEDHPEGTQSQLNRVNPSKKKYF